MPERLACTTKMNAV